MRLHIRRRDNRLDKKPGRFYFIDLSTLEDGYVDVFVSDIPVRMSYNQLLLDSRVAHPREYADALLRFLRRMPFAYIVLVNRDNQPERETSVLERYHGAATFDNFVRDFMLV